MYPKSPTASEISEHYASGYERDRLSKGWGQLERERTQELMTQFLPHSPLEVADIGGGPGNYGCWLATQGYQVHLLDIVPLHVKMAQQLSDDQQRPLISTCIGDARKLPWNSESFDAALLFGPLYHLVSKTDRLEALQEASRILKPGGVLLAVAICRFASVMDGLRRGLLEDPNFDDIVYTDISTGHHTNPGDNPNYFMSTYFHHPDELNSEISDIGFEVRSIYSIEGPSWIAKDFDKWWSNEERRHQLMKISRELQSESSLLGASPHIMAVAHKH